MLLSILCALCVISVCISDPVDEPEIRQLPLSTNTMPGIKEKIDRIMAREDFPVKLIFAAALLLWLLPAFSPLWRDEAITYWIIDGSWTQTLRRAMEFQEWSAAYFLLVKAVLAPGWENEFMLRLPSIAATCVSARALYLLGKRLRDEQAGLLAALAFTISEAAAIYASEARPYAAATACAALSTLYLVKLLDDNRAYDMVLYALLSALAAYIHILAAAIIPIHILYWACRRMERKSSSMKFFASLAAACLLALPLLIPARSILARAAGLMFAHPPGIKDLFFYLVPKPAIAGAAAVLALCRVLSFQKEEFRKIPFSAIALILAWALVPPAAFFAAARFSAARIWVTRYFIYSQAGSALCAGLLLSLIKPAKARNIIAAAMTAAGLLQVHFFHFNEDWRGAAGYADRKISEMKAPLILVSPYIESEQAGWLTDPTKASYLAAPLTIYPAGGMPALLPVNLNEGTEQYAGKALLAAVEMQKSAVVISLRDKAYRDWIDALLSRDGFILTERRVSVKIPEVSIYLRNQTTGTAPPKRRK